jgi:hypothetical protein
LQQGHQPRIFQDVFQMLAQFFVAHTGVWGM